MSTKYAKLVDGMLVYADRVEPWLWDRHEEILQAMDLQAPVQRKNLRTVLAALEVLREAWGRDSRSEPGMTKGEPGMTKGEPGMTKGEPGMMERIIYGIEHTARLMHFHGRWERLREKPLVIADIGHNAHALKSNFAELEAMNRPLTIVYGIMADKDLDSIIPLMPKNAKYIFVTPDTPRALPAEEIRRRSGRGVTAQSVKAGMEMAIEEATDDTLIYIGGSTFVVAEVL